MPSAWRAVVSFRGRPGREADRPRRARGQPRAGVGGAGSAGGRGRAAARVGEKRQQLQNGGRVAQPLDVAEVGKSPQLQRELLLRVVDKVWVDAEGNIEIEGVVNLPTAEGAPPSVGSQGSHHGPSVGRYRGRK